MYKQYNRSIDKRESLSLQEVLNTIARRNECNPKHSGRSYVARCAAHDDKNASLSISQGTDGKILMHCHAGCTIQEICASLDIAVHNLFPQSRKGYRRGR